MGWEVGLVGGGCVGGTMNDVYRGISILAVEPKKIFILGERQLKYLLNNKFF